MGKEGAGLELVADPTVDSATTVDTDDSVDRVAQGAEARKNGDKEEVIQFASGVWNEAQSKYPYKVKRKKSWLLSRPFLNSRCSKYS